MYSWNKHSLHALRYLLRYLLRCSVFKYNATKLLGIFWYLWEDFSNFNCNFDIFLLYFCAKRNLSAIMAKKSHKFKQNHIFKLFKLFIRYTNQTIQILNLIFFSGLLYCSYIRFTLSLVSSILALLQCKHIAGLVVICAMQLIV